MIGLLLWVAHPASAQNTSVIEVSGGYQYLFDIPAEESLQNGWYGSLGWNTTDWLAVIGEFAYSQKLLDGDLNNIDVQVYSTMGGVRFRNGGFFGQVLVGQLAVRVNEEQLLGLLEETVTEIAFQPGVGFDIGFTDNVAARVQADYRQIFEDPEDFGRQFRVTVGVAVGIGGP